MQKDTLDTLANNDTNSESKESATWNKLISLVKTSEADLRQAYDNSKELESILNFVKQDTTYEELPQLAKLLLAFVENQFGKLKSSKKFLSIVKQYVKVVKHCKNEQVIKITNTIIKTISSEKEPPREVEELPAEQAVQMWSSKESLCKVIAQKIPKKSNFLKYFEDTFNEIKNAYTIHHEENFESFFVQSFLTTTFNAHRFAEMDTFIEYGKININMHFDLHSTGDHQITLAHHLAQYLDCEDCYHLARRYINRINFKAVDKAGNTFMHHAVMSQWEHDLKPFIKKSDLSIRNKKGLTCEDLDRSMVKKNAKSVFE